MRWVLAVVDVGTWGLCVVGQVRQFVGWLGPGVNEMLLPKMVVCHEGIRLVAGVSAASLLDYVESKDAVNREVDDAWQCSFLQLLSRLPMLTAEELNELGGFFVMLKPNQALEVPGGYILAETCLSTSCVVSTWSCVRQEDVQEGATWTDSLGRLRRLVWEDMNDKSQYDANLKAQNDRYLARTALLLDAVEDLVKWLRLLPTNPPAALPAFIKHFGLSGFISLLLRSWLAMPHKVPAAPAVEPVQKEIAEEAAKTTPPFRPWALLFC